jgi:hypothetical protein
MPPWQRGLTRESLAGLKAAMARIAPHVPPDMLQQHYLRRIAELSNPTPETLYPALSYDSPQAAANDDGLGGIRHAPLSSFNAPAATESPYRAAVLSRFTAPALPERQVQPVRSDETTLPVGDLTSALGSAPLAAPNMQSAIDSPYVRAAMARMPTTPAPNGHIQTVRNGDEPLVTGDILRSILPAALSAPNMPNVNRETGTRYWENSPASIGEPGFWESLLPLWGPGRAAINDFQTGHPVWGLINTGMAISDVIGGFLVKDAAKLAARGLYNGVYKGIPKALQKPGIVEKWKQLDKSVTQGLSKELRGHWKFGSHEWDDTGDWYRRYLQSIGKPLPKDTPIHHYAIPQELDWLLPKWLINQPWNMLPMTRASEVGQTPRVFHNALHGWGKDTFVFDEDPLRNFLKQNEYGTQDWAKIGIPTYATSAAGNAAEGGKALYDFRQRQGHDNP